MMKRLFAFALAAVPLACTQAIPINTVVASRALAGSDDAVHPLPATEARFTALVFFADHCPCQAAHDARLRALYAAYHPRGVELYAVDSEGSQGLAKEREEAQRRSYPFPILRDPGAALARALHVEYATEVFVLNRAGAVRYHGGIDSDKKRLHDDAKPYLREALDELLAGKNPTHPESEPLGCALQID